MSVLVSPKRRMIFPTANAAAAPSGIQSCHACQPLTSPPFENARITTPATTSKIPTTSKGRTDSPNQITAITAVNSGRVLLAAEFILAPTWSVPERVSKLPNAVPQSPARPKIQTVDKERCGKKAPPPGPTRIKVQSIKQTTPPIVKQDCNGVPPAANPRLLGMNPLPPGESGQQCE